MKFYRALDRLMPRSFLAKVLAVAIVLGQGPLVVLLVARSALGLPEGPFGPALVLALACGLAGAALGLRAVLRPVERLEEAFRAFERGEDGGLALPDEHGDAVGRLMARASRLMRTARSRIDAAEEMADHDPLTGLLNRRGFERALAMRRAFGERGALLMMDLDHFKQVNDVHGHDEGDRVLRAVAALLRDHTRRPDLAARFGGEEFVCYLSGVGRDTALFIAERLRMGVEDAVTVAAHPQTVSIGVALWPERVRFSCVLKSADEAVYAAKAEGRNRVVVAPDGPPCAR